MAVIVVPAALYACEKDVGATVPLPPEASVIVPVFAAKLAVMVAVPLSGIKDITVTVVDVAVAVVMLT